MRTGVTRSQAVYRRSDVQPLHEDFRRHAADDDDPRKACGVGKVQRDGRGGCRFDRSADDRVLAALGQA